MSNDLFLRLGYIYGCYYGTAFGYSEITAIFAAWYFPRRNHREYECAEVSVLCVPHCLASVSNGLVLESLDWSSDLVVLLQNDWWMTLQKVTQIIRRDAATVGGYIYRVPLRKQHRRTMGGRQSLYQYSATTVSYVCGAECWLSNSRRNWTRRRVASAVVSGCGAALVDIFLDVFWCSWGRGRNRDPRLIDRRTSIVLRSIWCIDWRGTRRVWTAAYTSSQQTNPLVRRHSCLHLHQCPRKA